MRLGYDLTIEQTQKLMMTPELIQAIQILQLNTQELEEYVQNELIENPVLELESTVGLSKEVSEDNDDEIDFRERIRENDINLDDISYRQWEYNSDDEITSFESYTSKEKTLLDELYFQLSLSNLTGLNRKIGSHIIECIDDNGYLTLSVDEIAEIFKVQSDQVEDVLDVIQTFEPLGVGARTIEECLAIQLRERGLFEPTIEFILTHHMNDIAENKLNNISKTTGLSLKDVQMVIDLLKSLEPKPGRKFASSEETHYIIPDVYVERIGDNYQIESNDEIIPNLIVSPYYINLIKSNPEDKELNRYLNEKYDQANWLIKSIEQRKNTIKNVVNSVLKHQISFFNYGSKYLKTLTLKEVASDIGVHESTVSRSINGKYMQTPRGVFEIRYFFSSGVSDINGDGMSSNSVKEYIKEIIDSENPKNPFSDQQMVEILSNRGIEISRRTVAKYRENLNILSSSKRRRY